METFRRSLVEIFQRRLTIEGSSPNELQLLGDVLLKDLISTLDKPDDSGMLLAL